MAGVSGVTGGTPAGSGSLAGSGPGTSPGGGAGQGDPGATARGRSGAGSRTGAQASGGPGVGQAAPVQPGPSGRTAGPLRTAGARGTVGTKSTTGPKGATGREGAQDPDDQDRLDGPGGPGGPGGQRRLSAPAPATATGPNAIAGALPPQGEGTPAVPGTGDTDGHRADGPSSHTDHRALDYFRGNWGPDDKALRRMTDIRTVGGYLRIYTNLPESAHNSPTAITLCERGLDYLRAAGVRRPVVFVHARFGGNGNPVLANILGPSDRGCTVTHPAPG
ncbi:hypothetical protein [Nonomuraea sp. NPDC050783]|uniref:hypothetical protein n=1 Tax=Nonomuraea sp. NPDC050783 TaxID=3154634 RepID=UPI003467ECAC